MVYTHTRKFPKEERYGLGQQLNKSAVSIPSNIAEGAGRATKKDFQHFITIAIGSSFELETQLLLTIELELVPKVLIEPAIIKLDSIQKMMCKFRDTLN